MDRIQDLYALSLLLAALLLFLGALPALPILYCGLYACYNLFHPIR